MRLIFGVLFCVFFLESCIGPKSYCFFDPVKHLVYTTDGNGISSVSVYHNKEVLYSYAGSTSREQKVFIDSIPGEVSILVLTADYKQRYFIRLKETDLQKKKLIKFISQSR